MPRIVHLRRSPRSITPEKIDELLRAVSNGISITRACAQIGIERRTLYDMLVDGKDPDLDARLARARECGFDALADQCLELADHGDPERAKLQVWTRLQLLARWSTRYREHQSIEHTGRLSLADLGALARARLEARDGAIDATYVDHGDDPQES